MTIMQGIVVPGDCRESLAVVPENSIDAVVTDPPYHLTSVVKRFGADGAAPAQFGTDGAFARASRGFMGKTWDGGDIAFDPSFWFEVFRVMKPGAHLVAFGASRGYHRMTCAIEDAGFEIRDSLMWLYGTGFPKSHDIAKAINKDAGHWRGRAGAVIKRTVGQVAKGTEYTRSDKGDPITAAAEWSGWGTALKPAFEPIVLARKPLSEGTVAANVLRWGTGALNIDACRVGTEGGTRKEASDVKSRTDSVGGYLNNEAGALVPGLGRWPANVVHDGSDEVVAAFPNTKSGAVSRQHADNGKSSGILGAMSGRIRNVEYESNEGSAARFFYSAKASKADRAGSKHPTVKPVSLMQWLVRLVTPPDGLVLDPFAGSGTTGEACEREGRGYILLEREAEYVADIERRLSDPVRTARDD